MLVDLKARALESESIKAISSMRKRQGIRALDCARPNLQICASATLERRARRRLVLAQMNVSEKSNEIVAIPALLDMMAIEGAVITIDAMGCQRDIAARIITKKADYILALKGNQGTLCEDVKLFATEQKTKGFADTTISTHQTVDADHGRIETRKYTAIHDLAWLQARHKWPGLKGVLMVESQRETGGKTERETRFYITSLTLEAKLSGPMIRDHWAI